MLPFFFFCDTSCHIIQDWITGQQTASALVETVMPVCTWPHPSLWRHSPLAVLKPPAVTSLSGAWPEVWHGWRFWGNKGCFAALSTPQWTYRVTNYCQLNCDCFVFCGFNLVCALWVEMTCLPHEKMNNVFTWVLIPGQRTAVLICFPGFKC